MDYNQLVQAITALGVTVNDTYRAGFYITNLQDARTFLHVTLAANPANPNDPALGAAAYNFCRPALRSVNLLDELGEVLDYYVSPGIIRDMREVMSEAPGDQYTYAQYFENTILNADNATYRNNLTLFGNRIPTTADALVRATANFQANISTACKHIYSDLARIESLYEDVYGDAFRLLNLIRIKSTGSDFHKGGKQVLILTFSASYVTRENGKNVVKAVELKLVYKPSDLEADCLLAGDSASVNRALGVAFMTNSLFEIYNQELATHKVTHADFSGLPLNTYKILPRNHLSQHAGALPANLRGAYGYLQYLDYDVKGTASNFFGFYPYASSDFIIFKTDNTTKIVGDYYRKAGAMAAIAASFSLVDLHIENMRVMAREPYFIDMEICLTAGITDLAQTTLLGQLGGITGVNIEAQDYSWVAQDVDKPGLAFLEKQYKDILYQNRLWQTSSKKPADPADPDYTDGSREMIPVNTEKLLSGFDDAMTVLQAAVGNNAFTAWFARLDNVVVRYLPYPTTKFKEIANMIYVDGPDSVLLNTPTATNIADSVRFMLTEEYRKYVATGNAAADPRFVVLNPNDAGADYTNLDIPVFYHRIGSQEIVNSRGVQVVIPAQVTVDGGAGAATQVDVAPPSPPGAVNRTTYFANLPTRDVVRIPQVDVLATPGAAARISTLRNSIIGYFGQNDTDVSRIFTPIGKRGKSS